MTAAEHLWIWLNTSVYLVGAVTTAYYLIHVVLLAWEGWKREKKDSLELRASAERASQEQEAISIRKGVK